MTRTTPLAIGLMALPVLAGCAPGGTASGKLALEDSPLNAYTSAGAGLSQKEQQAKFEQQQAKVEAIVATCMADEGFEYIPVDYSQGGGGVVVATGDAWKPEDPKWVAQYGYGAVNYPGRDAATDQGNTFVDPNQDYVSSLSESEMAAYYETLYGPQPTQEEIDAGGGSVEYDWRTAGCQGAAQNQVQGDDPYTSDQFKPLMDAMNTFYTDLQKSPEFTKLNAAWATCMADANLSGFANPSEAQQSIYDELNAYYQQQTAGPAPDDPALAAIGEREIALATADLKCRTETDYQQQQLRTQFDLEKTFIEQNKADLEAFKAALEQQAG